MKILVIDDDEDIRKIARVALQKLGGMEFLEAANGPDGMEKALQHRPDVILLDVMMPSIDGPATLASMQQNPAISGIPVIFITAKAMPSEVERLKMLGATGVLTKPFRAMALAEEVRAILAGKKEIAKVQESTS